MDTSSFEPVLRGRYGVRPILDRADVQFAIGTATLTAIILVVILASGLLRNRTEDLLIQAANAFIVGLVAILYVAKELRRRGLTWEV